MTLEEMEAMAKHAGRVTREIIMDALKAYAGPSEPPKDAPTEEELRAWVIGIIPNADFTGLSLMTWHSKSNFFNGKTGGFQDWLRLNGLEIRATDGDSFKALALRDRLDRVLCNSGYAEEVAELAKRGITDLSVSGMGKGTSGCENRE